MGGDCRLLPPPSHSPRRHALWPDHPLYSVSDLRQQAHPSKVNGQLCCILRFFFFFFFLIVCIDGYFYVVIVIVSVVVVAFDES